MSEVTMHLTPAAALSLWREAARAEVGIKFPILLKDMEKIKMLMYKVRQGVLDAEPELGTLMLCTAPGGEEIWLVKKTVEAP